MKRMHRRWVAMLAGLAIAAWGLPGGAGEAPDAVQAAREATREAARKAAQFLQSQANEDGSFGKDPWGKMPGVVGLAMYALATTGEKPDLKQYPAIEKGAGLLAKMQQENGAIAIPAFGLENYNTSVAVMALKALNDPQHAQILEKAKKYILSCQLTEERGYDKEKHNRAFGGFGYGSSRAPDLSNTSFSLEALKALGIPEDSPAWKNAVVFIRRCQDQAETNDVPEMKEGGNTGAFTYAPGESRFGMVKTKRGKEVPKPYGSMTYAAVKSLIFCGMAKDSPELQAAFQWIRENYSVQEHPGGSGRKGYYYYVVTLAKAFTAAGIKDLELPDGRKALWYADLGAHLAKEQLPNGSFVNSDKNWQEADPVLATSYALIALNLCGQAFPK